jgi:hypothetical protein
MSGFSEQEKNFNNKFTIAIAEQISIMTHTLIAYKMTSNDLMLLFFS